MRFLASSSNVSRSPNSVAPVGQISAQAVCLPAATRWLHMMHLRTPGTAFSHSYRHAKRTCCHAVTATHTLLLVVGDGPESRLLQRSHWTHRSACRVVAVHAQPPHVLI